MTSPRRRRMGSEGGKQDKRGGGRGKKGRRLVGEERRREDEQGEMRGSFATTAVFKSLRLRGRARRPTGQCQGPADDHGHVLCQRCSPTYTPRMQYN